MARRPHHPAPCTRAAAALDQLDQARLLQRAHVVVHALAGLAQLVGDLVADAGDRSADNTAPRNGENGVEIMSTAATTSYIPIEKSFCQINVRERRPITRDVEQRYVIFDLDDTLVHSDAVREAFACVARDRGIDADRMTQTLDTLPGRPAREIFEALGLTDAEAVDATHRFLTRLDEPQRGAPDRPLRRRGPDAPRAGQSGLDLMLSASSSPQRAQQVLEQEGWDAFTVVLGQTRPAARARPTTSSSPPTRPIPPGRAAR